ncbi:MAG: hypothetical protein ACO1TE_29275 [Prosthecobacter sp.]
MSAAPLIPDPNVCPVPDCRRAMFPGDVVCLRCVGRVQAARPDLLSAWANRDLGLGMHAQENTNKRDAIVICAIQQFPPTGRRPRMLKDKMEGGAQP